MFGWLFRKKLSDVINETKKIKVSGITFTIRRVNILDYLSGARVLTQSYDTHKTAGAKAALATVAPGSEEKIKRHYADIIVAGVVEPKIVFKKENESDEAEPVENVLRNWELADTLYNEIMYFTYGKKKVKQFISVAKNLSK